MNEKTNFEFHHYSFPGDRLKNYQWMNNSCFWEERNRARKSNRQNKIDFLVEANNHLWKSFEMTLHLSLLADFLCKSILQEWCTYRQKRRGTKSICLIPFYETNLYVILWKECRSINDNVKSIIKSQNYILKEILKIVNILQTDNFI